MKDNDSIPSIKSNSNHTLTPQYHINEFLNTIKRDESHYLISPNFRAQFLSERSELLSSLSRIISI